MRTPIIPGRRAFREPPQAALRKIRVSDWPPLFESEGIASSLRKFMSTVTQNPPGKANRRQVLEQSVDNDSQLRSLQLGMGWFPEQGGGLNRFYHGLIGGLPAAGWEPHGLVAGSGQVRSASAGLVQGVAPTTASLAKRFAGFRKSSRALLRSESIDVVASHFALYTFPVLDLLRPLPLVVHFHGPWALESAYEGSSASAVRAKRKLETLTYRRATKFIVLSEAFRDVLCDQYRVPSDHIVVGPGGVDCDRFDTTDSRSASRETLRLPLDRPIIVTVRRLARRMGLENLIEAMSEVRRQSPDALLLIAGSGPLASELAAQIDSLDLANNVRLLGFVPDDDLPALYRSADVSVVPTAALEGFGLTVVESLAAGTPVVVTPIGGLPEIVRDLSPQLITADSSAGSLVASLAEVLSGAADLPSPQECKDYARAKYDWSVTANFVGAVYGEAMSK